jgi:hypothetical protein
VAVLQFLLHAAGPFGLDPGQQDRPDVCGQRSYSRGQAGRVGGEDAAVSFSCMPWIRPRRTVTNSLMVSASSRPDVPAGEHVPSTLTFLSSMQLKKCASLKSCESAHIVRVATRRIRCVR